MDLFAALPPLRWLIYESRVPTRHIAIAGLCFASALALQATFSKPPKCDKHCRHEEKRPRVKCRCCSRAGQPLPSRRGHDHNQSTQTPKKEIPVGLVKDIHHKEPRKQHHDIVPRAEPNTHRNKCKQPEIQPQFQLPPAPVVPDVIAQPPPMRRQPLPSLPRYPPPPGFKQRLLPPGTPYHVNNRPPLIEDSHFSPFQKSALNAHPNQNLNVPENVVPSRFQLREPFSPWADEPNLNQSGIPTIRPDDRTLNAGTGYINPLCQVPKPNDLGNAGPFLEQLFYAELRIRI
ncbi:hypothetical protein NLI96_g8017 [Meripilus lineatus]|uniref:Uncharacterized protein n=1 Tax=Meripilus lineatus TaxID=2056292 RepID=A0AAD5YBH7_9APHY|nr:hypothetical protein NLI96_g8017 [Physisporinus lineatus]